MESRGTHNVYYVKLYLFVTAVNVVTCTCKPGFAVTVANHGHSYPLTPRNPRPTRPPASWDCLRMPANLRNADTSASERLPQTLESIGSRQKTRF